MFLVDYGESDNFLDSYFWVTEAQICASEVRNYIEQLKNFLGPGERYECSSSKKFTLPCKKKTRTVGIFLAVYDCGLIASYKEIFGHETIKQATTFLLEIIENISTDPKMIIYDDACHLAKYILNKNNTGKRFDNSTERAKKLSSMKFAVDRFHFLTHTNLWCKNNCNPDLFDDLIGINTSVCEQTNYWFGRHKYIMKHMNYEHFHLFLFILSDEYNKFKLIDFEYLKIKKNK